MRLHPPAECSFLAGSQKERHFLLWKCKAIESHNLIIFVKVSQIECSEWFNCVMFYAHWIKFVLYESKHLKQFKSIYKFQRKCMRFIKLWTMNMYIHLIEGRRIKYSKIHQTLENGSCVLARLVVEAGGWRRLPPPPPLSPPSSFSSTPFIRSSRCFLFNILTN